MNSRCLYFAERGPGFDPLRFRSRLNALVEFYAAIEAGTHDREAFVADSEAAGVMAGVIFLGIGPDAAIPEVLWWLERPAGGLGTTEAVLAANDSKLRAMHNGLLAASVTDRVRIVTGPCGPTSLYVARGPTGRVWSTHAVAAAYLASGRTEIDPTALPELLTLGFAGGSHCLIKGARAVPPAMCIDITADEVVERCYWPLGDRWSIADDGAGMTDTQDALMRSLEVRLSGEAAPWLGLTAGLDSRVVAVALDQLGISARTFTWAHHPTDADGGRVVARALGLSHLTVEPAWHDEAAGLAHIDAEVRWNEGLGRMNPLGTIPWPEGMSSFVTGGAGEVGRAFWWRGLGRNHQNPDLNRISGSFRPDHRLRHAPREVRAALREHVWTMLAEIAEAGIQGWALLDVLYAEQRLTRWGRGMLGRHDASTVAAFSHPAIMSRLAAQSLDDRLTDGFHHYFLRSAGYEMPARQPPVQRRRVPYPARRLASRLRSLRSHRGSPWPWNEAMANLPTYRSWLTDGVLAHPAVEAALGEHWRDRMVMLFETARNEEAGEAAVVLSGPIALDAAIRSLNPLTVGYALLFSTQC